jgi:hypothetical protein
MAAVCEAPIRVAPAAIMASAASAVRIPPEASTPRRPPTAAAMARTASTAAPPAGWKPVDVLTKSAPPASAAQQAGPIRSRPMTAVSTITFSITSGPTAARTAATSATTGSHRSSQTAPRSTTMSTSPAPAATAAAASAALTAAGCAPDGKPVTASTAMPGGSTAVASGSRDGETQTAPTPSRPASRQWCDTSACVASGVSSVWSIMRATVARVRYAVSVMKVPPARLHGAPSVLVSSVVTGRVRRRRMIWVIYPDRRTRGGQARGRPAGRGPGRAGRARGRPATAITQMRRGSLIPSRPRLRVRTEAAPAATVTGH